MNIIIKILIFQSFSTFTLAMFDDLTGPSHPINWNISMDKIRDEAKESELKEENKHSELRNGNPLIFKPSPEIMEATTNPESESSVSEPNPPEPGDKSNDENPDLKGESDSPKADSDDKLKAFTFPYSLKKEELFKIECDNPMKYGELSYFPMVMFMKYYFLYNQEFNSIVYDQPESPLAESFHNKLQELTKCLSEQYEFNITSLERFRSHLQKLGAKNEKLIIPSPRIIKFSWERNGALREWFKLCNHALVLLNNSKDILIEINRNSKESSKILYSSMLKLINNSTLNRIFGPSFSLGSVSLESINDSTEYIIMFLYRLPEVLDGYDQAVRFENNVSILSLRLNALDDELAPEEKITLREISNNLTIDYESLISIRSDAPCPPLPVVLPEGDGGFIFNPNQFPDVTEACKPEPVDRNKIKSMIKNFKLILYGFINNEDKESKITIEDDKEDKTTNESLNTNKEPVSENLDKVDTRIDYLKIQKKINAGKDLLMRIKEGMMEAIGHSDSVIITLIPLQIGILMMNI